MLKIIGFLVVAYLIVAYAVYVYLHIKTPGTSPLRILFQQIWYELKFFLMWPAIVAFMLTVKILFVVIGQPLEKYMARRHAAKEKSVSI